MSIFVVGAAKGLGKYISNNLNSIKINRDNFTETLKTNNESIIISCARNKEKFPKINNLYSYYEDNIKLTETLCKFEHKKIIYMSTIEVYGNTNEICYENMNIRMNDQNPYAQSKLISEEIIKKNTSDYIILRLSALLGNHSNNFVNRLLKKENIDTTLSEDSIFNYILYEDIIKLLEQLIFSDYIGTLNVVSNLNIVLDNAVQIVGKKANFGNYKYFTPVISNDKLLKKAPYFDKSSEIILKNYINTKHD